jgi:FxsC-like protein
MSFKRHTAAYRQFVWKFSRKLLEIADTQGAAKVRDILDFDTLSPPFPGNSRPGLKFVRYVFVAGLKHQMGTLRQVHDSYANYVDRRDWRPCFPDLDRAVEGIATGPAKADSRNYEILPPSPQSLDVLREARRLNNVILILVDPWSVRLPELQQFLRDFDAEEFPNSAVLVNWNGKDPEVAGKAAQLEAVLKEHFQGRIGRKEYHKDPVSSAETIEQAVLEAFAAVQARLIELGKIRPAGTGDTAQAPVIRN